MPKFWVSIEASSGDAAQEASGRVRAGGIGTVGPASAGYAANDESWRTSPTFTAGVEADSPEAAEAKVRELVPDCEVGPTKPVSE